jgi:hypothetical protein
MHHYGSSRRLHPPRGPCGAIVTLLTCSCVFSFELMPFPKSLPSSVASLIPCLSVFRVFLPPWLRSVDYELNLSIRSTAHCPLCSFKVPKDGDIPNSSERDVILALAVGRLRNTDLFLRTLRTTGCRARCVFFVNSRAKSGHGADFFASLSDCGVQLVDLGPNPAFRVGHDYLRQIVYCDLSL